MSDSASPPDPLPSAAAKQGPPRQPRKRNVVSRDRNGCATCRRRHLRCDKTKPECFNCIRLGYNCEGYGNRIAFRDQTSLITQKFQARKPSAQASPRKPADAVAPETAPLLPGPQLESPGARVNQDETVMAFLNDDTWMWGAWSPSQVEQMDDGDLEQLSNETEWFAVDDTDGSPASSSLDFSNMDALLYPRLPPTISSVSLHPVARQCFQFPDDPEHFHRLLHDGVNGLTAIVPLAGLIADESFSAPYLYRAALAVTALCASPAKSAPAGQDGLALAHHMTPEKQALRHYTMSVQALHDTFPKTTVSAFRDCSLQDLLAWFLTRLLLANCDLRLGCLAAWRAHLRAAGRILSACHGRFVQSPKGRQLAHAFARMALLVELQNRDLAVTSLRTMNPGVASELSSMIERSESPRDRLLALIRRVSKIELKYRYRPDLWRKWVRKMGEVDAALADWQRRLPPSELPVDTGVQEVVAFPASTGSGCGGTAGRRAVVEVRPLTFPNSVDARTAAVNYSHFLCARMRARTRYRGDGSKEAPRDTEATVLHICRIAAGLSAASCAQAEAFGHGMLPAIGGAYYWTSDPSMRSWIWHWLGGYEEAEAGAVGGGGRGREGIWNVRQTRRLMVFLDEETERRRAAMGGSWDIIAAAIEEDEESMDEDDGVCDRAVRREQRLMLRGCDDREDGSSSLVMSDRVPFRIVLHSRSADGWATDCLTVP
ncbi:C6 zinc finger domain protein [Pleurostoma richardsiae]|uniref:C6 zinc finger domain protein n=1 Tax=Pleurostoma richardsiae TaxID=41990 RepID=A0AA38RSC3_9PEZI|nr:C6 zinc finger domain protein [Pleurostoma richardsiae]